MIDLGTFTPRDVLPPVRDYAGNVSLGRQTSTTEQRTEAVAWLKDALADKGQTEGKVKVIWSRGEPTILEVRIRWEYVTVEDEDGEKVKIPVAVVDHELHYTLSGAEIHETRAQKAAQLNEEVSQMVRGGQL